MPQPNGGGAQAFLQAMGGEEGGREGGEGGREYALDPVIILGVEHVLLIVKELALSPRLSACTQSDFREEEEEEEQEDEEKGGRLLLVSSLAPRHGESQGRSGCEMTALPSKTWRPKVEPYVCGTYIVFLLEAPVATDDLHIDCSSVRAMAGNFQES